MFFNSHIKLVKLKRNKVCRAWYNRPEHIFWHWFIIGSWLTLALLVILGIGFNQMVSVDDYALINWPSAQAQSGPVEFISTIKQSVGDYSSLSSWWNAMSSGGIDLTVTSTKVFSHTGITGTIADGALVTGDMSGATATAVHTTPTQILLKNIVGTFQSDEPVRVDASNYVTLTDVGNSVALIAKIDGTWTVADTAYVNIQNAITSASNYIKIYTTPVARHTGKWDDTKYRLVMTSWRNPIVVFVSNVIIDGLQIQANNQQDGRGIAHGVSGISNVLVSNNIIRFTISPPGTNNRGISFAGVPAGGSVKIWDNIVYGFYYGIFGNLQSNQGSVYIYNNTVSGNQYGIVRGGYGSTVSAKNNIAVDSAVQDYYAQYTAFNNPVNNISSDATSPNTSLRNQTVSFVDTSNNDYHLASSDTAAKDMGVDLSSDANLAFASDIDGQSRPQGSSWDIGADEVEETVSAPPSSGGGYIRSPTFSDSGYGTTDLIMGGTVVFGLGDGSYGIIRIPPDSSGGKVVHLSIGQVASSQLPNLSPLPGGAVVVGPLYRFTAALDNGTQADLTKEATIVMEVVDRSMGLSLFDQASLAIYRYDPTLSEWKKFDTIMTVYSTNLISVGTQTSQFGIFALMSVIPSPPSSSVNTAPTPSSDQKPPEQTSLPLPTTASLSGIITVDSFGGSTLPEAVVTLQPINLTVRTDAVGHYQFDGLKEDDYSLAISQFGYRSYTSRIITVKAGDTLKRNFYLSILSSGTLQVTTSGRRDISLEKQALGIFGRLYSRLPLQESDWVLVRYLAYGGAIAKRDLSEERRAINRFYTIFRYLPSSTQDWRVVHVLGYGTLMSVMR
ncbi:hypothetical protein A3H10_04185 [Candidatus Uhrbacteria bacterium RIFCSPLOWO2_12_FULL_46_10]|uniref:Uncharacterized protein n=1 Tax=Candidatus Uhrbacteria bacterium RIFCSPLOWO2_01_FULL_47_25 TaxID=1802402 RepID=A0A1F7UX11_9BACT|nr:MAG: hypothetical protein UX68_C0001G0026 [Parcubacteria group bacterium GW2011_GWA2_46_9]OGL60767.1 MAG: hypothetical protein A2752_03450 [Candidatus Uhrbacteria bacterium RIFCSPHIGHO2_01_FULL_46_23]OGL70069.1 MAG: hypothetical protein A3D60_03325 [Candidatus Uhrbacteria bacterium RIFCSPHIGHO2_02_FULL_47_29]OGL75981.1 MAG: hypothetical protein A3E96_01980 [Candidatus Uhrbacteria bacterium RIFCSPHIGHO2_12_FULL_46_13]OGL82830.1 MAG: hypothetical protein A2936_04150 [Candidatus Uhrbacteria bac